MNEQHLEQTDPGDMDEKELIALENQRAAQSRIFFYCVSCGELLTDHRTLYCDKCKPRN